MQNFWGIEPGTNEVVEKVEYEKNAEKFYGANQGPQTGEGDKKKLTKEEAVKIFFAVDDKESRMENIETLYSQAG